VVLDSVLAIVRFADLNPGCSQQILTLFCFFELGLYMYTDSLSCF
jgi:hypothetical protein